MKLILFCVVFLSSTWMLNAQTVLAPGDIAVIGFKTTGSGRDQVRLLATRNIECGTQFILTDRNWNASTNAWQCTGSDAECAIVVTVTQELIAGVVLQIDFDDPARPAPTTLRGIGAVTDAAGAAPWGTNFGLSSGTDNVTVLQGTFAAPTFIFAARNSGTFASGGNCASRGNTGLPTGLTLGTTAVDNLGSKERPHYNCPGGVVATNTTRAALLAAICNPANWIDMTAAVWNGAFSANCTFTVTDAVWGPPVTGSVGVSGAGCGCLSGCNLSSLGGPNCSPAVSGDCSAGYQSMSVDISVPAGCSYTVLATMRVWNSFGCTASGADGNCAGCDRLKVDLPAGAKAFQIGGSNATLNDNYTLTGPGTIRISGGANRADERIVYRILSSPCASCGTFVLPVELLHFSAKPDGSIVRLQWVTASETENDYYTIEKSRDNDQWEVLGIVPSDGGKSSQHVYTLFDTSPFDGISYYRLKQTDLDGTVKVLGIQPVDFLKTGISSFVTQFNGETFLKMNCERDMDVELLLTDITGRVIRAENQHFSHGSHEIPLNLEFGLYMLTIRAEGYQYTHKIISGQ